jgi:hypothetical protein
MWFLPRIKDVCTDKAHLHCKGHWQSLRENPSRTKTANLLPCCHMWWMPVHWQWWTIKHMPKASQWKNPSSASFLEQFGKNTSSGEVDSSTVKKHFSWESVENDTSCYIDQSLWIELLQDEGIECDKRCPNRFLKPRNKATRSGNSNRAYNDLCVLSANKLFEVYSSKMKYFNIYVKWSRNDAITVILGWIVNKRQHHITSIKM